MAQQLVKPERFFLEKFGLTERHLERGLGAALGAQIDYADLYFEYRISEVLSLEEGMIKRASKNISQGAGVRALAGETTLEFTRELPRKLLLTRAKEAQSRLRQKR